MRIQPTGMPTQGGKTGTEPAGLRWAEWRRNLLQSGLPAWIPGLWALFLTVGSMQPSRVRPLSQGHDLHSVFHVLVFGTLGSLAMLTNSRWSKALRFVCCLALGLLIEVAQARVYPDAIEWQDVRDDTIGVVLFSAITLGILSRFSRRK
jgi:hypothetical protein